jgi:hypothetical protein
MQLLSLCLGSFLLANQTPVPVNPEPMGNNPFISGIIDENDVHEIKNFDMLYIKHAPDLLNGLKDEVRKFYQKNPQDPRSKVYSRYFKAVIARLAFIQDDVCDTSAELAWAAEMVPATSAELVFIVNEPVQQLVLGKTHNKVLRHNLLKKFELINASIAKT